MESNTCQKVQTQKRETIRIHRTTWLVIDHAAQAHFINSQNSHQRSTGVTMTMPQCFAFHVDLFYNENIRGRRTQYQKSKCIVSVMESQKV